MGIRQLWTRWVGDDPHPASHGEKFLSALGAFLGIMGVEMVAGGVLDTWGTVLVVSSMGSSAVLLFAVPHSPMSQPWPVIGGHLISAAIGMTCVLYISDIAVAASLAVSLSIWAMYYTRSLHAPGGATALVTVLGGPQLHALGYSFLVMPVLINVMVLLSMAMAFNAPFLHRRYPLWLARLGPVRDTPQVQLPAGGESMIAHSDLVFALTQIDTFIDISEDDLLKIYKLATQHALAPDMASPEAGMIGMAAVRQ